MKKRKRVRIKADVSKAQSKQELFSFKKGVESERKFLDKMLRDGAKRLADANIHDDAFVTTKQLAKFVGRSMATIWRWRQNGHLPRPVILPTGQAVWRMSEIRDWCENLERADR